MKKILKSGRILLTLWMIVLFIFLGISDMSVIAKENINTKYRNQGYTKEQIIKKWNSLKPSATAANAFSRKAITSGSYRPGTLKPTTLKNGINLWNFSRWLAGLDSISLSKNANQVMAKGALVNAANNVMSHNPAQPAGMDAKLYREGKKACGSANIFWGMPVSNFNNTNLMYKSVAMWLDDSDRYNVERLGHRRWMLYPQTKTSGFGAAANSNGAIFTTCQSYGLPTKAVKGKDKVSWPAAGYFPIELFQSAAYQQAWSLSLGKTYSRSKIGSIKVTMTDQTGKTETFSSKTVTDTKVFTVETTGYGTDLCIIFRPKNFKPKAGSAYNVRVSGLKKASGQAAKDIVYDVSFFSLEKT
jgi:hypothetical protein